MTLPVSSEFMALCQGQLRLLASATGASLSTIYIAEEWLGGESTTLVPIAVYPESVGDAWRAQALRLTGEGTESSSSMSMARPHWEDATVEAKPALPLPPPSGPGAMGAELGKDLARSELPVEPEQAGRSAVWGQFLQGHSRSAVGQAAEASSVDPQALSRPSRDVTRSAPVNGDDAAFGQRLGSLEDGLPSGEQSWRRTGATAFAAAESEEPLPSEAAFLRGAEWGGSASGRASASPLHQAVQPLFYDNRAVGILVVAREQEDWQASDYSQLEQVAQTLSAGCSMERRLRWLQGRVHQQEVAQERQQDILDNLAHQFRNPLTALRTFGKLLIRRLSPDDRNQAVAAGIVRESDRLQVLLQQITQAVDEFPLLLEGEMRQDPDLGTSSAAASVPLVPKLLPAAGSPLTGQPLPLGPCDVSALVQSYRPAWEAIAQEQGHELICQIPADLPAVQSNAEALGEVLSNLVDNAFKYGAARGRVVVSVDIGQPASPGASSGPEPDHPVPQGWQHILVSDEGGGIPRDDLARLFERHFRGIQAQGNKPGTGLGLAIVKGLVEQMGGQIEVHSPAGAFHPRQLGLPKAEPPPDQPGTAVVVWLKHCAG